MTDDIRWTKIRSWHAVKTERILNFSLAYCGRFCAGSVVDDLPLGEKTCESCLRIVTRKLERAN